MNFTYENQGHITYLSYAISPEEVVDTMTLGMITNNKIMGLAPSVFTQMDTTKYLKYNVSSKISLQQFFSGAVTKRNLLNVFKGIISGILVSEEYMIDINSIVFDLNYIFIDVSTCEVAMISLPVQHGSTTAMDLNGFFKNIMFTTQFDQSENCDYVAKIINYLNATPVFLLEDFKTLLDSLSGATAPVVANNAGPVNQEVPAAVNVQPVSAPPAENVQQPAAQQPVAPQPVAPQPAVQQPVAPQPAVQQPVAPQPAAQRPAAPQPAIPTPKVAVPPTPAKAPIPPAPQKDQDAGNDAGKKKGGLFGLFSSNEKKVKEEKPIPTPVQNNSNGFAIPGQKTPVQNNSNGFAIPGQKTPVQNNSNGFAIPGQKASVQTPPVQTAPVQTAPAVNEQPAKPVEKIAPTVPNTASVPLEFQNQSMNFGETTVLGGGNIGETTVLGVASPMAPQEMPHLIRTKNNEKINLNKPVFRIGKEKSYVDYFIGDNTAISRSHANFITRDGEYFVTDTNSTNHTYVNGAMIQSNIETKLSHGDKVRLANEDFEFKLY